MSRRFPGKLSASYYPPRLKWRDSRSDEPSTPFGDGSNFPRQKITRPLRITLDTTALTDLGDRVGAQAILDFHGSPLLELFVTNPNHPGGVQIPELGDELPDHFHPRVDTRGEGWTSQVTLPTIGEMNKTLTSYGMQKARRQLALAWFHKGWDADILISTDPTMHELAAEVGYLGLQVVTPPVGARIFGLLLRYHEQFILRTKPNYILGRWPFYWSLARQKLPAFWRYFSACLDCPDKTIGRTGGSILHRAARALEARDFVGHEHYGPASHDSADRSAYHFDYLLLLLTGAMDAMALVAKTAYALPVKDFEASFRRGAFKKKLASAGGAAILDWLELPSNADALSVLHDLRNRIHGAGLQDVQSDEGVLFEIPPDLKPLIPKIRQLCPDTICVSEHDDYLQHYPLAIALVDRALGIMDGIAERTDVTRLLPPGKTIPAACLTVPKEDLFSGPKAARINALG